MSVQSRRKSRFRSLCDDEEDGKAQPNVLQCHFIVSYIGETVWRDEFTYVDEVMESVLPKQVWSGKFWSKKEQQRKVDLFIDNDSAAVYIRNSDGIPENSFTFCNIKEVIYCGNMKQYSKYLILIVNGQADLAIKAHVFALGSVKEAKNAFKIFTDLFAQPTDERPQVTDDVRHVTKPSRSEIPCSPLYSLASDVGIELTQKSSSEYDQIPEYIEENFVESAFTALARSRSFNSGQSHMGIPLRPEGKSNYPHYSLPAE